MPTVEKTPNIRFDVVRIFQRAGDNPRALRDLLIRHVGDAPSLPAVQMWRAREAIPTTWLAAVLYCLMKEGHRVFELMVRVVPRERAK